MNTSLRSGLFAAAVGSVFIGSLLLMVAAVTTLEAAGHVASAFIVMGLWFVLIIAGAVALGAWLWEKDR